MNTAVGPVRGNHAQIRVAKTEPAEDITMMDQLEIASILPQENEPERQTINTESRVWMGLSGS